MNYDQIVNRTVRDIPPSGIRKFFDIVSTMKDAISLGVGEPDFVTPWNICESAIYSIEQGQTHYTSNWGTTELRREIAAYLKERCGVSYNPADEILVTVGASEGIDLALRALVEPGDEVLVPEPSYVSYAPCVRLAGGVAVGIPTDASLGFRLTGDLIRSRLTPRTKALILPYPNNPTGAILEREDLLDLARALEGTNVIVLSDEIYSELTYGGRTHVSFASIPGMFERTITLNGFSKAFAMTGWRMGYACAPAPLAKLLCKIHQFTALCAPVQGQAAALEALRSGRELECIYIQSGSPKGPVAAILNKAREQGIPVKEATREKLTQLSGIETHQGVAAICAAAAYAEMKDIYERAGEEPLFVVICDNIEDPHNLGAIIRTAEACGAHGVIIPKRHSAGLTAAAVKSSAGAAVCLPVVRVANIVATMQSLKAEKNVWFTCADMDGVNWCQLDFKGAVGLVIGSEGNGVSRLVKEECDFVAALPMQGQINSLNASVAGGIILYEITRQRLGLKAR